MKTSQPWSFTFLMINFEAYMMKMPTKYSLLRTKTFYHKNNKMLAKKSLERLCVSCKRWQAGSVIILFDHVDLNYLFILSQLSDTIIWLLTAHRRRSDQRRRGSGSRCTTNVHHERSRRCTYISHPQRSPIDVGEL
jgi:hypothetical protein